MAEELKPGIYFGVPYDTYAAWPAMNHSRLKYMRTTPLHARYAMLHEKPATKALDFGWAAHITILEPERFEREVMEVPKVDRRTTAGKLEWAAFEKRAAGRLMVTPDEMANLVGIRTSVLGHATAREYILGEGKNEVSFVWRDPESEVLCKARSDRLATVRNRADLPGQQVGAPLTLDIDLKTMEDPATQRAFEGAAYKFGYFEQAAMRLDGLQALHPIAEQRPFVWIVAETKPPYAVRLFSPDEQAIEWGRQQYKKHLMAYAECVRTGVWPGWDEGIDTCSVPPWVGKVFSESA